MQLAWTETHTTPYDTDQETQTVTLGNIEALGVRRDGGIPTILIGGEHRTTNETRAFAAQITALADAVDKAALR